MKPAPRWPLHPAPKEGEALSSWLNRVAVCYQMEMFELLEHDLGHSQIDDLDTAPPLSLLTLLSQRSGIELDRLRGMIGYVGDWMDLSDFLPDGWEAKGARRRSATAATFAASLELARQGRIEIRQTGSFAPISFRRKTDTDPS